MLKKIKNKKIFLFIKLISNIKKKKKIFILGPYGNYSFNILIKKINKKIFLYPICNLTILNLKKNKISPIENNNGGIVRFTLNQLEKKKIFINIIIILNIKHNFFIYKKKKKIFLHNQSLKQTKNNLKINFNNLKFITINSNSEINNGLNIINKNSSKILPIIVNKIQLKDNLFNKTKFIISNIKNIKKKIISLITNYNFKFIYINLKKILNIYIKKNVYLEIFFFSLRYLFFTLKLFKNYIVLYFTGFYSII